jgi:FkbM family methyltransferase
VRFSSVPVRVDSPEVSGLGYDNSSPEDNGEYSLIAKLLTDGFTIFDVGCAFGNWTARARSVIERGEYYLFEPRDKEFMETKKRFKKDADATVFNLALGDKSGKREFKHIVNDSELGNMSSFYHRPEVEKELNLKVALSEVDVVSVDDICARKLIGGIDYLKIDTEGAELDIVKGSSGLLAEKRVRYLQFEYGGTYRDAGITLRDLYNLLSYYDYSIFRISERGLIHIPTWRDELENYRYANYLAAAPWEAGAWTSLPFRDKSLTVNDLPPPRTVPLLSIFMPVHNREKYLPETVDSLLGQSYANFELIVVDDGSTDNTPEIIKEYAEKDPRIRPVLLGRAGLVTARNTAVKLAHPACRYIMNHDSDDISLPGKLEKLVNYLNEHPEIDILGCRARYFDNSEVEGIVPEIALEPEKILETFGKVNSMVHSASLIRRDVFRKVGLYRESYPVVNDYDFFARALRDGYVLRNLPDVLHLIRIHGTSISATRSIQRKYLRRRIQADYTYWLDKRTGNIWPRIYLFFRHEKKRVSNWSSYQWKKLTRKDRIRLS